VSAEPADRDATEDPATSRDLVAQLDDVLLGARRYRRDGVATRAGIDEDWALALWRAMGFPEIDPAEMAFTDADIEALREADDATAMVADDVVLATTRAMGRALSRLAEAELQIITEAIEDGTVARAAAGAAGQSAESLPLVLTFLADRLPRLDRVMAYVLHRHLAAAAGRTFAAPSGDSGTDQAIGFADLVGFTELVRELDRDGLAALVSRFEQGASDCVTGLGGRVVKTVGDEVLFEADDLGAGAEIGLRLAEQFSADRHLPDVRVGLAAGPVLARFGDVYGPVVNVAARLTALARPGSVLVDRAMAGALDHSRRYETRRLRPTRVRGYPQLRASVLRRAPA
jgi:adenylate cyclase